MADYSNKKRVKVKKNKDVKPTYNHQLDNGRNKKVILVVVGLIIFAMIATLITPFLNNQNSTTNWTLSNDALTANEKVNDVNYNPKNIMLGQSLNRNDKDYFVLVGAPDKLSPVEAIMIRQVYYKVDSTSPQNASVSEKPKNNKLIQSADEIKVGDEIGLIQVKEGKVVKYFNTQKDVDKFVKTLK